MMRSKQISSTEDHGNISDVEYWDSRYSKKNGGSGDGSQGRLLAFKAHTYNMLAQENGWASVIDLGCGTGNIVNLIDYGVYLGYDVSKVAIQKCQEIYSATTFRQFKSGNLYDIIANARGAFDVAISLDVTFHITKWEDYVKYMNALYTLGDEVLIFTPNEDMDSMKKYLRIGRDEEMPGHVFYRKDVDYLVELGMKLKDVVPCPFDARDRPIGNISGNTFSRFFLLCHD